MPIDSRQRGLRFDHVELEQWREPSQRQDEIRLDGRIAVGRDLSVSHRFSDEALDHGPSLAQSDARPLPECRVVQGLEDVGRVHAAGGTGIRAQREHLDENHSQHLAGVRRLVEGSQAVRDPARGLFSIDLFPVGGAMMTDRERSSPQAGVLHDPYAFAIDDAVAVTLLADLQVRKAIARGEFDDLPGSGEPIELPDQHDPEWWVRSLIQREHIALLPPSIQLRKDDAALDAHLDQLSDETAVRREIDEYNERVIRARYEPPAGPPLITMPRDPDATVAAWAGRRAARAAKARQAAARVDDPRRNRRRLRRFRRW